MMMRTIARICFIEAIAGRTLPCDIRDSEIATFDASYVPEQNTPFCAVYTDKDDELTLVLGVTLAAATKADSEPDLENEFVPPSIETGMPGTTARMPATDLGLEMTIDVLEYQIIQALKSPGNIWADLLKAGARIDLDDMTSVRGTLSANKGAERLAGREIRIGMNPLKDLNVGDDVPEAGFWPDLFEQLASSDVYAPFRENYERLRSGETRVDWQQIFTVHNLNAASIKALGQMEVEPNA